MRSWRTSMTCPPTRSASGSCSRMSKAQLTAPEAAEMFRHVADQIQANVDRLTQADQAIGDGDHGIGMARGFAAAREKLTVQPPDTVAGVLRAVGMALLSATGGAAGAIFGTFFRGGARRLDGVTAVSKPKQKSV